MTLEPITRTQARAWMRLHFGEARIPHTATCYFVRGLVFSHPRHSLYLVASEDGMEGIFIVRPAAAAKERAG